MKYSWYNRIESRQKTSIHIVVRCKNFTVKCKGADFMSKRKISYIIGGICIAACVVVAGIWFLNRNKVKDDAVTVDIRTDTVSAGEMRRAVGIQMYTVLPKRRADIIICR